MYNILDYGADNCAKTLSVRAFQAAVDDAAKCGGTVYVPDGKYLLGTVRLYSNVHIVLSSGSVIYGSRDLKNDFYPDEHRLTEFYQDTSHSFYRHSLFLAEECENISITGGGMIDMQGQFEEAPRKNDLKTNKSVRGAKVIAFRECRNVTLCGFSVRGATDLAVYLGGCEDVRIQRLYLDVKIDGISPDCCRNVIISDCIVKSGDDAIVIKSSYTLGRTAMCENVTVSGCIVTSDCNGIKLGTESNGGFRNIIVSSCTLYNIHQAALAIECADGGVTDGVMMNNIVMNNAGCPFIVVLNRRLRAPKGTKAGILRNITLSGIIASGPFRPWKAERCGYWGNKPIFPKQYASFITGLRDVPIENVTLRDINITVDGGENQEKCGIVPENETGYPAQSMYGDLKSYGLFMRHIRNLRTANVEFRTIKPDTRPPIIAEDCI